MSILTPAEAVRLLREQWANPTMLAEELFSILTADLPDTLNAPVTVNTGNNPPNTPLFQLDDAQPGQQVFSFGPGGSLGSYTFDPQTGLSFDSPQKTPVSVGGGGSSVANLAPCTIQSGGPASYSVALVTGPSVTAIAWPQPLDTAPPGTQAWAYQVSGTWYVQFPVWI
jgi:hypothetical protein